MNVADRVRLLALGILTAVLAPVACDAGGIVGGSCRSGTTLCDDGCVDLARDPENCGECGQECGDGQVCSDSTCTDPTTGGTGGTGGTDGTSAAGGTAAEGGDVGTGGSDVITGGRGGRGGAGGRGGGTNDAGQAGALCLPPFDVAEQCGDCDTVCAEPTPLCSPDDTGSYGCVPECELPLIACGDQCVDTNLNPLHCGRCNNVCPSGICQAGECVGATTGHVALFCLNYVGAPRMSAHGVMLGNAVFLPLRSEVRILAFAQWAPGNTRNPVNAAIQETGLARGRTGVLTTVTDPALITSDLNVRNYDVFLVYEQTAAPAGALAALGANLRTSTVLDSFARAGGVIVVLNGAQGTGEMAEFIRAAGLMEVDGQTAIALDDTTTRFFNRAPGDALGINVLSPLSPVPYSCTFDTSTAPSSDTVFVLTDAADAPVVVHRIVAP